MTAPTVAADDAQVFSAGTTHAFDLTAGMGTISAGDLLVMFAGSNDGVTFTEPSGWTEVAEFHTGNAAEAAVFYLVAAGGETSASFDISASETATAVVWRVTGHDASNAPAVSAAAAGGSINPDSAVCTPGTTEDFLYITAFHTRGNNSISVYPYANGNITISGTLACAGGAWTQTTNSSSENPGAFTKSGTQDWMAVTIAIFPGAATLSSPTPSGTLGTDTTATCGATTNTTSGTFYSVVESTAALLVAITAAQIKAGNNNLDLAADAADNNTVTTTSPTADITGLTAATAYSYASVQNSGGGDSNIVTGTFTTAASGGAAPTPTMMMMGVGT